VVDLGALLPEIAAPLTFVIGLALGLVFIRLVQRAGKKAGVPGLHAIRDILTAVWAAFAVVGVLRFAGLASDLQTITFSGIVGLTLSLAVQSTLSNMIAGLLLFRDKALRLHDEISYSGVRGSVVSIGFRNVWIKSIDGSYALVSNSALSYGPLINYSAINRIKHKIEEE
jgi:small-conductance mechanosensitive channel